MVPAFKVRSFGRFDSRTVIPNEIQTEGRVVQFYEFEIFLADQPGVCFINDGRYELTRGTVLCAKPGQTRYSLLPFQCHYIYILTDDPQAVQMLNALPDCLHTENPEALTEIFRDPAVIDKSDNTRFLLRHGYVCKFLHQLMQLGSAPIAAAPAVPRYYRSELMRLKDYICNHLSNPLTLEELSAVANLSPNYLHRLFTARFGCTPNRYVTTQRIQLAKSRLAYTDQTLAQVAMDCGFSSQSYFTRCFSRETGKTPLQYRKDMQGRILP